ncbi:MAG: dienelactone hydrolase family protein [Acidobacteria bacterium]|nr:dienelactone hydrolase family protein [Acidobacteriota bacterium]
MSYGRQVSFSSASGRAEGYLSRPGQGRPGIVVIQEWWGLVPHVKAVADRFAAQGYIALAPDLYHGKSTVEAEEAEHLMTGLDWARAVEEIGGAVGHLRDTEGVDRVGVVGFCMGGALTVLSAALPGVDAYVAFYGFPPGDAPALDRVSAPGQIFFGEHEGFFSVPDAQAFAARQRAAGRETDVVIFPGAGHAFFNDDRPDVFHRDAANEAWRRTLAHFGRHLRNWTAEG